MGDVHAYSYRVPRMSLEHPIEFCTRDGSIAGFTRDVSDTGLLVRLQRPVPAGSSGKVRWQFGGCLVEIEARVAYADFLDAGLSFHFATEGERQFVQNLVKLLTKAVT